MVLEDITILSSNNKNKDKLKQFKDMEDKLANAFMRESIKNSFVTEAEPVFKIHWYNGLLTARLNGKTAVIQLKNGKIIKDLVMDKKEYREPLKTGCFYRFPCSFSPYGLRNMRFL